ncbi:hypothetical protein OIU78_028324 [Salix suchowensis]|nr:hypothetical protein OIU78_028324 [Salix suchowensis]
MLAEGLNNAINSTTVVAVLIASVTFAAIYTVPGEYIDDPNEIPPGQYSLGEANVAPKAPRVHNILRLRFHRPLHLSGCCGGANISRSHREQGEKTDDESHQRTDVDSLCPSFRRISSPIFAVAGERERWLAGNWCHKL